jgi:hypothetical protein
VPTRIRRAVGSSLRANRTRAANAIRFHFGEGATTNSAASETFEFMEFEMKHCASTLGFFIKTMISAKTAL